MDWIKAVIYTTSEGIEPVSGRLYALGITGIEIEDEQDFKDFLENILRDVFFRVVVFCSITGLHEPEKIHIHPPFSLKDHH